jgi:Flp pilus assembly protein TadD
LRKWSIFRSFLKTAPFLFLSRLRNLPVRRGLIWVALLVAVVLVAAWSVHQPASIVIDYPLSGSVFAPDMEAPTILWRDPAASAVVWRIDVAFANGTPELHQEAKGEAMRLGEIDPRCVSSTNRPPTLTPEQAAAHTWKPDAETWSTIKRQSAASSATITISGFAAGDFSRPISRGSMEIHLSTDPVGASIFYRDVPLMPSKQRNGVIKPLAPGAVPLIAWRIRNVSEPSSRVVMQDLHSCANCHSFSGDGKTLGMDMDGPENDKGIYALVSVRPQMTIRNEDMISWSSFRPGPGSPLREGFMSKVSPDGRYVVTTIRPPGDKGSQIYYLANFEDYRFLQVFYPTRGILAWYDRETRTMQPLPGADDPRYVQTGAVWSPDGKYLVFSRAVAKDPVPTADGKMATYANDPAEVPIQYDLYRIPFNGGLGGKAEPIAGASNNGMSNSFPKISPDGKWIVFVQAHNGQLMRPDSQLYIVPAAGGSARRMNCNTSLMNSWHSFSPNSRWLVFSSKSRSPYTQMFLTHIDADGNDSPAILIENSTAANRAVNIPEFVNVPPAESIQHIATPAVDFYKQFDVAATLALQGKFADAIPEWNKALALSPDDARTHNSFGLTLARAGKTDEAIAQYRKALAVKPHYSEAHNNLGAALDAQGNSGEAVAQYRQAIEDYPGNAEAHNNLGHALAKQGHLDEAVLEYEAALAIRPEFAEAHNNLGVALNTQGHLDEAVVHYRKAIDEDAHFADAYNNLGVALVREGNFEEAVAQFGKALAVGLETAQLHDNLGIALTEEGKMAEATAQFERAVQLSPRLPEAHYFLGRALVTSGQEAQGLEQWRQTLRLAPDHVQALNDTAWLLATSMNAALRNGVEATTLAEHAVQLTSARDASVLGTLAAAYAEAGRFDRAIESEQRAIGLAVEQGNEPLAMMLRAQLKQIESKTPIRQQ